MMIQVFLTVLLVGLGAVIALQRTTSRFVRLLILATIAVGTVFVWVPDETTAIAETLGVGRGADLILYVWVILTLALILVLYLKVIRMGRKITLLTRAIAVANARTPEPSIERHGDDLLRPAGYSSE
jgi:small membrane protein